MKKITTQKAFREHFWFNHPELTKGGQAKRQNEYPCDTRCAFVDFVDAEFRAGFITEKLAQKITL